MKQKHEGAAETAKSIFNYLNVAYKIQRHGDYTIYYGEKWRKRIELICADDDPHAFTIQYRYPKSRKNCGGGIIFDCTEIEFINDSCEKEVISIINKNGSVTMSRTGVNCTIN